MGVALILNLALAALVCGSLLALVVIVVFWLHDDEGEGGDGGDWQAEKAAESTRASAATRWGHTPDVPSSETVP
jgi:hypothetical protein